MNTLYVRLNSGKELVVTVPWNYKYEVSEECCFGLDKGALHFFDGRSGERIN
ncbi:MAG: hypothetical protein ACRC7N_01905 [Clostridium sp.]